MHDDRRLIEDRLARVLHERIVPAIYPESVPLRASVWVAPDEPVPVAEGLAAPRTPIASGDEWGAPWGTSWLTVEGTVPQEWAGRTVEALIDLGFEGGSPGFQCEGLVYRPDGSPVKGLHPRNQWVRVAAPAVGGEQVLLHVEAASNPGIPFQPNELGDKLTAGDRPHYRLGRLDLAIFDEEVWQLVLDFEVLCELMHELPEDARRYEIVLAVGRALDAIDLADVNGTATAARARLAEVLARPATASAHRVSAIGHAHIDTAWLWPLRETVRKVARTAANMTALLTAAPEFVFTMSQAAQYDMLKQQRPEIYEEVRKAISEGRFVPTGGMWVEADTNMPGSEAMARQFVLGKRFFLEEFGIDSREVWLPDTFGFAAGLPQIIKAAGSDWLLTQKISWSRTNTFPHHSFLWEGIDGTRIFTHFPPVDTYNSALTGRELAHAARNFKDKGRATRSLAPVGFGDGGGGTTREMIAKAARVRDLEGSPTVQWQSPAEFFAAAQAEYQDPPVWVGELYLELHRATLTSQAATKQGNRRGEHLLREAELWAATAAVRAGADYPYQALDRIWKTVLLLQFHDILPGSSIAWVHREAAATYADVTAELTELIRRAQWTLGGEAPGPHLFNPAPHAWSSIPAGGAGPADTGAAACTVTECADGGYVLTNELVRVEIDHHGLVASLVDLANQRETLPPGAVANLLQLHPDYPNAWDAWDVDAFYRNTSTDLTDLDSLAIVANSDRAVAVRALRRFGSSTVTQTLTLRAGDAGLAVDTEVDWRETEKFLKLAFPLDIHAERYAAETQFGHLFRPTHTNTSWEQAKFEACNHRFVHVAEPGWGVALVSGSTYGHDVTRTVRPDGGATTTLRFSLLRAPRFPDPRTDQGVHRFRHAIFPGTEIGDAVREGYRINLTAPETGVAQPVRPLFEIDDDAVVTSAVKLADDGSGDVVLRVYESRGGRATALITPRFDTSGGHTCDLLERPAPDPAATSEPTGIRVRLRPFQLLTLRFPRSSA
ncbi:alpha-mannosidase [Nocardia sp. alder85J]|uniref:alpha-mannosidase n=1 Tax=Nocardia sp. alder85J TaxID=2862949 RepID=UPI001CD77B9E|nr:glycoside hydrolase family 38 C-terminal domain-containing protein [Nocardia sp. alder85J]MCX4096879.1 glycosyl hydrolase-related protein [Nocardia sp. alder85J]